MKRGRRRQINNDIPAHIEQEKIPDYCYWDKNKKHWYAITPHEGRKPTRQRIAGSNATLGDLHKLMEELRGVEANTFRWLSSLYKKNPKFLDEIVSGTRKNYEGCERIILNHPTRINKPLGSVPLSAWSNKTVQKLIDQIAANNGPRAANMCLSYASLVFKWGLNRGHCALNPCIGIEKAKERKRRRLPESDVLKRLITLAKEKGGQSTKTKRPCTPYLWCAMVIGYECRLRAIETINLTDADISDEGILCVRVKGSRTNRTEWNQALRDAVQYLKDRRSNIWDKRSTPLLRPEERFLFVNETGGVLRKAALDAAFNRFMKMAIKEEYITEKQRFGLHDLKRRGTCDCETPSSPTDRKAMSIEIPPHHKRPGSKGSVPNDSPTPHHLHLPDVSRLTNPPSSEWACPVYQVRMTNITARMPLQNHPRECFQLIVNADVWG